MYQQYLSREKLTLAPYAAFSDSPFLTIRSVSPSPDDKDDRLPFQRDRDRIIHSRAFRRMMHKTQVFHANKGDHYRNRLTHTLEVCQIARSIGKMLGLNDELIEAIALGHDVGHSPFGHVGERQLHRIITGKVDGIPMGNHQEGFKHNFQSIHLLENLERYYHEQYGLNLTNAVLDGILKHTKTHYKVQQEGEKVEVPVHYSALNLEGRVKQETPAITLEGQVVNIADEIAQATHDLEDAIRAQVIYFKQIRDTKLIQAVIDDCGLMIDENTDPVDIRGGLIKHMVGYLIKDVYQYSKEKLDAYKGIYPKFESINDVYTEEIIGFSDGSEGGRNVKAMQKELDDIKPGIVIASEDVSISDVKAEKMVTDLFRAYYDYPQQLPDSVLIRYYKHQGGELERKNLRDEREELQNDPRFIRAICDHIGSMTDQFATREYSRLF